MYCSSSLIQLVTTLPRGQFVNEGTEEINTGLIIRVIMHLLVIVVVVVVVIVIIISSSSSIVIVIVIINNDNSKNTNM